MHRQYARAPRGEQVISDIKGHKTQRVSIVAGLIGKKLIAPWVYEGYTDTDVFNHWVEHVLLRELPPGYTAIMDRATFHRSAKTRALFENAGCRLLLLPAYSPDFNPIEQWWAILKAKIKAMMKNTENLLQAIDMAYNNLRFHKKNNHIN